MRENQRTIAVPLSVHRGLKVTAKQRGMKLREIPGFLIELLEVTTPEQHSAAYSRYLSRHVRRGGGAVTSAA